MKISVRYRGVEVEIREVEGRAYVPRPTPKYLDQFEAESGLSLPASFREFAITFGAGELGGFYRIATPMLVRSDYDLQAFHRDTRGLPEDRLWEGYPPVIEQMYFFAATVGGVLFAWNRKELSEVPQGEGPVYSLPGFGRIELAAPNFAEFVVRFLSERSVAGGPTPDSVFTRFLLT